MSTIHYNFNGDHYDFDLDGEELRKGITHILRSYSKEELIDWILDADLCKIDLSRDFRGEIKQYFKEDAEHQYMEDRYENGVY